MRVYPSVQDLKEARLNLGAPGDLVEALVATGIDALFALLDGETVEIGGVRYVLAVEGEGKR
jgi:hypothetical protein